MNESVGNKFDAAMDLIMSKALKEEGYDSLILKGGKQGDHTFIIDRKNIKEIPKTKK